MYLAGRDHPNREPCRRFLAGVRSGDIDAVTSTEVLQEILYRYAALRRLDLAARVYDLFVQICPAVLPVTLADTDRGKELLCATKGLSARDAIHAAVMINNEITRIATFDVAFKRVAGIQLFSLT